MAGLIQPTTGKISYPKGKPLFHYLPEKFYSTVLKAGAFLERMGEIDGIPREALKKRIGMQYGNEEYFMLNVSLGYFFTFMIYAGVYGIVGSLWQYKKRS